MGNSKARKGRKPGSQNKVKKREEVGKSAMGCDHPISQGEKVSWVAQDRFIHFLGLFGRVYFASPKTNIEKGSH